MIITDRGMRATILVVDDEPDILEMIEMGLAAEGYALVLADGGMRALSLFDARRADLVICDIKMPGLDGISTITRLREQDPHLPVIVLTGFVTPDTAEQCSQLGVHLIRKPFAFSELSRLVSTSLRQVATSAY
jgi:DNA-binding response OmpR family regulator